jgi:transposase
MELDRIEMSEKEVKRLEVLRQLTDAVLSQREAGRMLGLSERQVRRLACRYAVSGAAGLVSRRRGRASNRRFDAAVKQAIVERVRERYGDFGPTLAAEYLRNEGLRVSKETLRGWMTEAELWRPSQGRRQRLHPPRPRRPRRGELIQIDGSPHDWFEGRGAHCTLLAFIDDATSRVMVARFVPVESTQAYLDALQTYVTAYGCPAAFYSDRHGIFTKHNPEDGEPTQFQRAIAELDIAGLQALTPQAKGRVERLFQTLQDRLVKALRLGGIDDIDAANAFLSGYLEDHNARFAVTPEDSEDAHSPLTLPSDKLARSCALHHRRTLSKDLVLSFHRQRYILQTNGAPRYALRGQRVTVVQYPDGRIELLYGQESLPFKVFDQPQPPAPLVDDKTLNARVDDVLTQRKSTTHPKPSPHHPWQRPFKLRPDRTSTSLP